MRNIFPFYQTVKYILSFCNTFFKVARLKVHNPTLNIEVPNNIRFDNLNALTFGKNVSIGPYSEIVVISRADESSVEGVIRIGNNVKIGMGANIRAAGGKVIIGESAIIAQNVAILASNHLFKAGQSRLHWDTEKTGVVIEQNVWIGAGVIILPGVKIGTNSVIAAGAVVTRDVPADQIWAGVPAVFLRSI